MHTTSSPATTGDIESANASLIAEFVAQAEVVAATHKKYRFHLREFAEWLGHPKARRSGKSSSLIEVTAGDVNRFMAYLKAGDRFAASDRCRVNNLSATARKNFHASLHSFYRYLVSVELREANPVDGVLTPKVVVRPGMTLTAEELRTLLDAPGNPRDRVQTYLLAYTGARVNELRCLLWRDVDFVKGTMMLLGKRDKYRMLDIHPRLMSELRRWYIHQSDEALRNPAIEQAKADPETDFVLLSRNGRKVAQTTLMKTLKLRAARVGLYVTDNPDNPSRIHPHVLRRSLATILLNDGHPLDAVSDLLGHSHTDTARIHYAFSSNERRRATILAFKL